MNKWIRWAFAGVLASWTLLAALPQARAAVTPKKGGDLVREVQIRPTAQFASPLPDVTNDPNEVIAGREHCEKFISNDNPVTFAFTLEGTVEGMVESAHFFATPTSGLPNEFECDDDGTNSCDNVNDRDIFRTEVEDSETAGAQSVQTVSIDFEDLVFDAAENLPYQDELTLIESVEDCHPAEEDAFDQQYFVRLFLRNPNVTAGPSELVDAAIRVDTIRPPSPSALNDVTATESTLYLSWTQAERGDAKRYFAFWSTEDISGLTIDELQSRSGVTRKQITLDDADPDGEMFSGTVALEGVNTDDSDVRIFTAVVSRDRAENFSQPVFSDEGVEVLPVIDFWERYREAGGSETGGCSATGGSLPAGALAGGLFGAALLGWRRRRR